MRLRLLYKTIFIVFLTVSGMLQAGSVKTVNGKTRVKVVVFELPDPTRNSPSARAGVAIMKSFIRDYPKIIKKRYLEKYKADPEIYGNFDWENIELDLVPFSALNVEGVETDLLAIAGGMAPDILYINFKKSDNYIRNNFLYPLDEYVDQVSKKELDQWVNPRIWPVIRRKGPKGVKHVWAMPSGGAIGRILLFHKELFDKHSIPYPDNNWTWAKMLTAAKMISDPGNGIYGMALGRGKQESWNWMSFLWSAGGEAMVYNEDTDQWRCTFDSTEAVTALDFYVRLSAEKWYDKKGQLRRGYSSKDAGNSGSKWKRGEIGMRFAYIDERLFSAINPDVTGMVPVPLGPTGLRGAELNSRMMGIFSEVKSPVVRDAAWEYMRYINSTAARQISTKIMVEGGLGRFINPKYLRMFGYSDIEKLSPKGWAETYNIAVSTGKPEPYGKNSNYAYDMMTFPIQEAENMSRNDDLPADDQMRRAILAKMLKKACARANEKMIGIISPAEQTKRRTVAVIALSLMIIGFSLVFAKIFKSFSASSEMNNQQFKGNLMRRCWPGLLLLPAMALIFTWKYIPLARGSAMAFYDYKIIGESIFVGIDNFADVLFDGDWWRAVYNSLRYSFLMMSMTFLPPIILAVLLQEVPKGKILFRTIYYLPAVITGMVTILLWKQFYAPSERGMLNSVLLSVPAIGFIALGLAFLIIFCMFAARLRFYELHWQMVLLVMAGLAIFYACVSITFPILIHDNESFVQALPQIFGRLFKFQPEPYNWLSDPDTAMTACIIPMVWAGMGPGCLIYLAALKGIPDDYYEAADIDGATFIDKILFVVFPTLKALIIINFVGVFISSWYGATGMVLALTGGGANTEVAGLHIWKSAFTYLKMGPAAAMAWLLGFMLIGFTVHQLRILSRVEFKTTGKK
jgi:ABC-type sugar transport system permease subunit/ABC-type glycerol-3-phosphate transport system substrate-binding protein